MAELNIEKIADDVKSAQDYVVELQPMTTAYANFDLSSAYEVARRVHDRRTSEGAHVIGRKIGFTNSDMWALFGVTEPVWGYVYGHTLTECPEGVIRFDLSKLCQPRIEPEVVFHFRDAPKAGSSELEILRCIDWVAHGVEIVQSHFPEWKFKAADTVADNGLHGALIIGPHFSIDQFSAADLPLALEAFSLELLCGDEVREKAHGRNVLGSPLTAVAHLLKLLQSQGDVSPIKAGEVVTTGTITKAYSIKAGEKWSTRLEGIGLPGLQLTFT